MGIDSSVNVVYKAEHVVARELDAMLNHLISSKVLKSTSNPSQRKRIDCNVSNIIHSLSFKTRVYSIALVREVASFLKRLASETGYIITAILDSNICPQSKRDAFNCCFLSTMNCINGYYYRQSAMKLAAIPIDKRSNEEKKKLDLYNREAKTLESSVKMSVPTDFME